MLDFIRLAYGLIRKKAINHQELLSGITSETVSDIKKALAYRDARAMQVESKLLINVLLGRSTYFALP